MDVEWSDWCDGTEEWCTQNGVYHKPDIEDVTCVREYEYDNDSISALLDYESAYVHMLEDSLCVENDNSYTISEQTNSTVDDIDSISSLIDYEEMYASLAEHFYKGNERIEKKTDAMQQIGTEEDEMDNIPLAEWIKRLGDERTQSDDLDKTLDYTIFIEEINSDLSDEISTSTQAHEFEQCSTPTPIRDKGWKRRGKHIKRGQHQKAKRARLINRGEKNSNKADTESSDEQNESGCDDETATEIVIRRSIREKKKQELLLRYHKERLDKILASNMLKRKEMPADGNCLLSAALHNLGYPMSVHELRLKIAQHIDDNAAEYITFVTFEDNLTPEEELDKFLAMIEEIKQNGKWNTYMADFVPLCIANIFQRTIRIFSSLPFQPILDIKPHISTILDKSPIVVAHIAIHGNDHYDAVETRVAENNRNIDKGYVNMETENETDGESRDQVKTPSKRKDKNTSLPKLTPHKDAEYKSPKRKRLSRKRAANKSLWKANIRKTARSRGLEYINKHGKAVKERSVKNVDCSKCRFKCTERISEEERKCIFQTYWAVGDYNKQRQFICSNVENKAPQKISTSRKIKKTVSNSYFLSASEQKVRVCRNLFLKTLDIGKKTVECAVKQKTLECLLGLTKEGKHHLLIRRQTVTRHLLKSTLKVFQQ